MSDPVSRPNRASVILRVLVALFTAASIGSLILVVIDVAIGRPAAGDVFIASLNCLAAGVLWRLACRGERT